MSMTREDVKTFEKLNKMSDSVVIIGKKRKKLIGNQLAKCLRPFP
jgi:hypothetical protein